MSDLGTIKTLLTDPFSGAPGVGTCLLAETPSRLPRVPSMTLLTRRGPVSEGDSPRVLNPMRPNPSFVTEIVTSRHRNINRLPFPLSVLSFQLGSADPRPTTRRRGNLTLKAERIFTFLRFYYRRDYQNGPLHAMLPPRFKATRSPACPITLLGEWVRVSGTIFAPSIFGARNLDR